MAAVKQTQHFPPFIAIYFHNPIMKLQEADPLLQLSTALRNPKYCLALPKISHMTVSILKDRHCLGKILEPVLRLLPESCSLFFLGPYLARQEHPWTTIPAVHSNAHAFSECNDICMCTAHQKRWLYWGIDCGRGSWLWNKIKGSYAIPPIDLLSKGYAESIIATRDSQFFPYLREGRTTLAVSI